MTKQETNQEFRYTDVIRRGKPVHAPLDAFSIRHPAMLPSRRAKIFSPFDALKGFQESISAEEISYVHRRELTEEEYAALDETLRRLQTQIRNSRIRREQTIRVTVEHFVPCADPSTEAYDRLGLYESCTGVCREIDLCQRTIMIDDQQILLDHISALEISEDPV